MKNPSKFLKLQTILLVSLCYLFSTGCTNDEITGDARLKVINKCDWTLTIYFDDSRIGTVSDEDDKTWDVPSGTHTVRATCYGAKDYEGTHKFTDGNTTVIPLDLSKKNYPLEIIPYFETHEFSIK